MLGSTSTWKHIYALDAAAADCFEWDYENADPDDLYEALELCGWEWDEETKTWISPYEE